MKKLYVIGNGFDLHHDIPSSYHDYKEFLKECEPEFVRRFDDFLERYVMPNWGGVTAENIDKWSELESYTRFIYQYDLSEILDEAIESSEDDMDRASYWNDIQYLSDRYSEWIDGVREMFGEWIKTLEYSSCKKDLNLPIDINAMYLNFNYTDTLEVIYDVPCENVLHIHGNSSKKILFGNNQEPEKLIHDNMLRIDAHEDADWRVQEASEILNTMLEKTNLYFKDTYTQIIKNKEFFQSIEECEIVYFMGFSFGCEDQDYIDQIIEHSKRIKTVIVYYRGDDVLDDCEEFFVSRIQKDVEVIYQEW